MRRSAVLMALAMLGGCAVVPVAPTPYVPANPDTMASWTASGRLAMAANGEGGSGSFTWEQQAEATTLSLRGPLGAGALQVTSSRGELSVVDSDGRRLDTRQTRELLRQRLGADLPWQDLRYWMLGVAAPGEPAEVAVAAQPPLRVIEQGGWRIGYDAYRPMAGVSLPTGFTATRGGVRLKVIVDDWEIQPAPGLGP